MEEIKLTKIPIAQAGLLIRKPASQVYEAFVDPEITTHFWFTKSSGRLMIGKQVHWEWEMYGVSTLVVVKALEPGRRSRVEWDVDKQPTQFESLFSDRTPDTTFVSITNSGFSGDGDKIVEQAMDSAAGFELVLAGLKAYLEYGIELNLVADRHPDMIAKRSGIII
jgi:uncharacterized protein YndB with AHSA1/START domain